MDPTAPYRDDLHSVLPRIAAIENELARLRAALSTPPSDALAALRVEHLRQDRALIASEYRRHRRTVFGTTGTAMVVTFALSAALVADGPDGARMLWLACGIIVSTIALLGSALQSLIARRARSQVRAIDRRIAEEEIVAANATSSESASRVRVQADPLDEADEPVDPLLHSPERARAGM